MAQYTDWKNTFALQGIFCYSHAIIKTKLYPGLAALIGGDKVKNLKPAPDGIVMALKALGGRPSQAIMVGDSYTDIGAGHAAEIAPAIALVNAAL